MGYFAIGVLLIIFGSMFFVIIYSAHTLIRDSFICSSHGFNLSGSPKNNFSVEEGYISCYNHNAVCINHMCKYVDDVKIFKR